MKVLIVGLFIEPPFAEGTVNVAVNWSKALSQTNVSVRILSLSSKLSGNKQFFNSNFRYVRTKKPRFKSTLSDWLALQSEVTRLSHQFDIVHYVLNKDSLSSIPFLSLLKLKGTKQIVSYQTGSPVKSSYFIRNFVLDAFSVPSKRLYRLFRKNTISGKMRIIRPCIDAERFKQRDKNQVRKLLGLPTDAFLIFVTGHFKRGRRLIPFVETVEKLAIAQKNLKLIVGWTGHGNEGDIIEAFNFFRKKKFVTIIPPTEAVNLYYNAADVYALSATSSHVIELPMSILEALASGIPVVSFNINATPEIIVNGFNGYLIEDGNFDDMEKAFSRLIEDEMNRKRMSENARFSAVNAFSYQAIGSQLKSIYSEIMQK